MYGDLLVSGGVGNGLFKELQELSSTECVGVEVRPCKFGTREAILPCVRARAVKSDIPGPSLNPTVYWLCDFRPETRLL